MVRSASGKSLLFSDERYASTLYTNRVELCHDAAANCFYAVKTVSVKSAVSKQVFRGCSLCFGSSRCADDPMHAEGV
jgi:hypothetical protein